MIQAYFTQIKMLVERYAIAPFVLDAAVNFDLRPGDQGYLTGSILFTDYSTLHFREFLDASERTISKLTYTYHYQDKDNLLIFRYDNARHRPRLSSLEHKHTPAQAVETSAPVLEDVLLEIVISRGWV